MPVIQSYTFRGLEHLSADSNSYPANPYEGELTFDLDTNLLMVCVVERQGNVPAVWEPVNAGAIFNNLQPWDASVDYKTGDSVLVPGATAGDPWTAYHATAAIAAGGVAPGSVGASSNWVPVGQRAQGQTDVWTSSTSGDVPGTGLPSGATPVEGSLFVCIPDRISWVFDADLADWIQFTANTVVTVTDDPNITSPAATTASEGDIVINRAIGLAWTWGIDPDPAVNAYAWIPIVRPPGTVTITATAGEDFNTPNVFSAGYVPQIGDRLINIPDANNWIFATNPTSGQDEWVLLPNPPSDVTVTITALAGDEPFAHTFPPTYTAREGDSFYNTSDEALWLREGATWVPVATGSGGSQTFITDTEPTAPFTAANRWGFGTTSNVEPDPVANEPEPGDFWIMPTGTMGMFN